MRVFCDAYGLDDRDDMLELVEWRILSSYDALIDNNNRRIKLLEEMGQRNYREDREARLS